MIKFSKPDRKVIKVFLHCSDSDIPEHDNIETITRWHVDENGWTYIGYQYVITQDGVVHKGRSLEIQPAAQYPFNRDTIAICLTGRYEFSEAQYDSLRELCSQIAEAYEYEITFHGHNEIDISRTCPVFPYRNVLGLDKHGYITKAKPVINKEPKSGNIISRFFSFFGDLF